MLELDISRKRSSNKMVILAEEMIALSSNQKNSGEKRNKENRENAMAFN